MRHDLTEFRDEVRVRTWRDHLPAQADTSVLVDEALGHAVGLRDALAESRLPTERALHLMAVLNQVRESMAAESSSEEEGPD
jgi:hypothetical protein